MSPVLFTKLFLFFFLIRGTTFLAPVLCNPSVSPCLVLAELWHPHQVHGQVEEEEGEVLGAAILGGDGFFRAARAAGRAAARSGDTGFLRTGQEPGRCLRAIPGSPRPRIATKTTVWEIILCLYLE